MEALSFPFRFKRGRAIRLDTSDESYQAQKIASVISTRRGELPLKPTFGIKDPEFNEFDTAGFSYTVASEFPDIQIKNIVQTITGDGRVLIDVEFDILTEGNPYAIS